MELVSRIKLIEVLLEVNQPDEAEIFIMELETHSELTGKDTMTLCVHLAECRYQQRRYNESLELLQPLIDKLETDNYHDAELLAKIRNIIGKVYHQTQDYNNAYYNYRKAFDYTLRFTTQNMLTAHISFNVATTLLRRGNPEDARSYLQFAHDYYKDSNRLVDLAHTIYHQGISYKNSQEFHKAAECFEKAKNILEAQNELKQAIIVSQANASEVITYENPELAIKQLKNCLDAYRSLHDIPRLVHTHSKIAKIYLNQMQIEQAYHDLMEAEQIIQSHSLIESGEVAEYYKIRSSFEYRGKNHNEAIHFANMSYEFFGKIGALKDQIEVIEILVDVYEHQGDFQSALSWEKKRSELYSILFEGKGIL
ncbi:tetratricopeptide repeat protein [Tumebacillus permanentifrigoris]|uniref:Soluble NSF attachment protein (SNAP)-like n=1 Tax=Tumebacillus permanentifrigoris TaxID=378543 RepID=A0A316DB65_9BACL|nr:tetratricopeptide repeat protein [Tumebacillus permanentifrigoris]PWK11264.1 soluble NSF attachment protein (SNAP)-like [Tumebacillus permanentifrigoris]